MIGNQHKNKKLSPLILIGLFLFFNACSTTYIEREVNSDSDFEMVWEACRAVVEQVGVKYEEKDKGQILSQYFKSNVTDYPFRERSQLFVDIDVHPPHKINVQIRLQHEVKNKEGYWTWENYGFDHDHLPYYKEKIKIELNKRKRKLDLIRDMVPLTG